MKKITTFAATLILIIVSTNSIAQSRFITDDGLNTLKANAVSFSKNNGSANELVFDINANESAIKWSTSNEANMSHFELQISNDGTNFTTLNKVAASDYTQWQTSYKVTFRKRYLSAQKVYYRVKAVFADNSVEYTSAAVLNLSNNGNEPVYASLR